MSKLPILPLAFAATIGLSLSASAGPQPVSGNPGGYNTEPIVATPGSTSGTGAASDPFGAAPGVSAGARQKPGTSDASDTSNDSDDNSLTRLKTQDSLGAGSMSRDDGQLTAKPRRREKVLKVESTKQLPTSGSDPKFQGSLLHSSVTSIRDVGEKSTAENDTKNPENDAADEGDSRFKASRLVFAPSADEGSKKTESTHTKAESSPSPTSSPSASPSPASH